MTRPPAHPDPQDPSAALLLQAYRRGVFPMVNPVTSRLEWFSPDPRAILPLDRFHVPKSLARVIRRHDFEIRSDTSFEDVMRACAEPRRRDPLTWIDDRLIRAYVELHRAGHAHSMEAWRDDRLVGGLYGVHVGAAFFGESMFVRPEQGGSASSKICLVHLVRWLRRRGFRLLDTQFRNPHLDQFGCVEISRDEYLRRLQDAVVRPVTWGSFTSED